MQEEGALLRFSATVQRREGDKDVSVCTSSGALSQSQAQNA